MQHHRDLSRDPSGRQTTTVLLAVLLTTLLFGLVPAACGGNSQPGSPSHAKRDGRRPALSSPPKNAPSPPSTQTPSPPTTALAPPPTTSAPPSSSTPPATTSPTIGPDEGSQRNLPVASAHYIWVDNRRQTRAGDGTLVAPTRTLPTTVWYPSQPGGPWPLVVFGHGFQVGPRPYARLCQQWASAGYVVAAPSFPLSDQDVAGSNLDESDISNEPGDMSFVVTQLLALTTQPPSSDNPLAGRIDALRVAAAGHSDGATASVSLGYAPGYADPRLRAVIALSADPFPDRDSVPGSIPLLSVHGDADTVVPFANAQRLIDQVQTRRYFLVLHGADHLPPVEGGTEWTPIVDRVTTDFLDRYLAGRTTSDEAIRVDVDHSELANLSVREARTSPEHE